MDIAQARGGRFGITTAELQAEMDHIAK